MKTNEEYFEEFLEWRNKNPNLKFKDWIKLKSKKLDIDAKQLSKHILDKM